MSAPNSPARSGIDDFPQELLDAICAHIFDAGTPNFNPSLDPLIGGARSPPTAVPNSFPPASWTDHSVRKSLASLCMVNKAWYYAAKPQLWRRLEVRLPRSWLSLVDELAGGADREAEADNTALVVEKSLQEAQNVVLAARSVSVKDADQDSAEKLHSDIMAHLDGSVPPEVCKPGTGAAVADSDCVLFYFYVCSYSLLLQPEIRARGGYATRVRVRPGGGC